MCGIGGKLQFDGNPDPDIARRMNACMDHRGPDAAGVYANGPAVLAHRRLSILDLSDAGRQPMSNADGTVHIVFNGEIYNYRELREKVDHYRFQSETDTEVLLHLYEEFGEECLQYLRGMFAFAIWDERDERLFLARDRLGQKPLFYRKATGSFVFGSTIKAILADTDVRATPDLPAIRSYLTYQYVPSPRTGFRGIRQLEPGHFLAVTEDEVRKQQYWDVSFGNQLDLPPDEIADRLIERLREATRLRLRSDVPVGVFLSGGIDSSLVTALASELSPDPVETYAIGFDVEAYDELEFARTVADEYGTDHTEYTVEADSMLESLPALVDEYEMPFGDTSALPTYHVSRLASQDVTVALGGDAGDENFAGYDRYRFNQIGSRLERVPRSVRSLGHGLLDSVPEPLRGDKRVRYPRIALEVSLLDQPERYARFVTHATGERAASIWNGPPLEDELANLRDHYEGSDGPTELDRILDVDLNSYLPDDILFKVDRASMAHSLEVRSPFLDHEVVEYAARIPAKYKLRRGTTKWILKQAADDLLPDHIIHRSKQGFGVPVNEWLRGELNDLAAEKLKRLADRPAFDSSGIDRQFEAHQDGTRENGYYLWDLLMLEEWYEQYIDD